MHKKFKGSFEKAVARKSIGTSNVFAKLREAKAKADQKINPEID